MTGDIEDGNVLAEQSKVISSLIRYRLGDRQPKTAIILGSGLGALADDIKDAAVIPYSELNGFPVSTIKGHDGKLIAGRLNGVEVLCMKGRIHLYEGYSPQKIAMVIRSFKRCGIENLVVTNAAGSLNSEMGPGSLMIMTDHINLSGMNPLVGPNDDDLGPRFPDMSAAYDSGLREKLLDAAEKLDIKTFSGVYVMMKGPNFETPAEIRMARIIGGDAIGMSTVPEVLTAVHCGMKVVGISVITNYGAGMTKGKMSHAETIAEADKAGDRLRKLVTALLPGI